jgi:hypothetical protein
VWHHRIICTCLSHRFNFISSWLIMYDIRGYTNVVLFNFVQLLVSTRQMHEVLRYVLAWLLLISQYLSVLSFRPLPTAVMMFISWFLHCQDRNYIASGNVISNECGSVGGMRIGRGNRSYCKKTAPMPLHPPIETVPPRWVETNHLDYGTARNGVYI